MNGTLLMLLAFAAAAQPSTPIPQNVQDAVRQLVAGDAAAKASAREVVRRDGDARIVRVLEAYRDGLLATRGEQLVVYGARVDVPEKGKLYPVVDAFSGEPVLSEGKPVFEESLPGDAIRAPRPERAGLSAIVSALSTLDPNPVKRRQAIMDAGDRADEKLLDALKQQLEKDPSGRFAGVLRSAIAKIELTHGTPEQKLAAAVELGKSGSQDGVTALEKAKKACEEAKEHDTKLEVAIASSLESIAAYQSKVRFVQHTFAGLSLASILILLALGLAIIFGLMGVINMAHGEFMMIGGFATYVVAEIFQRYLPSSYDWYFVFAFPAAFLTAGAVGWLVEMTIVRRLYGRPLETLLATFGLGLILIQIARVIWGDTVSVSSPGWLQGGWEIATDLAISKLRLFIIGLCVASVATVVFILRFTKFGLLVRATTQNREMAAALGVPTRRVDGLTFAFGAGLAGVAGVIVPLYNKLKPDVGQEYIVQSFMTVVSGGVGNLSGVIFSGAGLGFLEKYVEPLFQYSARFASSASVLGKVLVLMAVVFFLSLRPSGLFPAKGRNLDA